MMKPRSTSSEGHGPEPTPDDTDHELSWTSSSLKQADGEGLCLIPIDFMVTEVLPCDASQFLFQNI